jgi:serine/threonine protein kinase
MRIGVTPFFNKNKQLLFQKIERAKIVFPDKEKYGLDYTDEFQDIVCKLLDKDKSKRLGSTNDVYEVLQHPWFADINVKDIEAQKIEPPLKPDVKDKSVEFKYFNTKQ